MRSPESAGLAFIGGINTDEFPELFPVIGPEKGSQRTASTARKFAGAVFDGACRSRISKNEDEAERFFYGDLGPICCVAAT